MRVVLHADLTRPGVRAMLRHLTTMGVDPRVRHVGDADLCAVPGRDLAWLAAHSPWRGDASVHHRLTDLWTGPEPAPGRLIDGPAGLVTLAIVDGGAAAQRIMRAWRLATCERDGHTLVIAPAGPGAWRDAPVEAGAGVVLLDEPPADLHTAVADAAVVVTGRTDAAGRAAAASGRVTVPAGPNLAARLAAALDAAGAPPAAADVAALVASRLTSGRSPATARRTLPRVRPVVLLQADPADARAAALADALHDREDLDVVVRAPGARAGASSRTVDLAVLCGRPPAVTRPRARRVAALHWGPVDVSGGPWVRAAQVAADELWVTSRWDAEQLVRGGVPERRVMCLPVGPETPPAGPVADLGEAAPGMRFVFTGDPGPDGGLDLVVAAHRRAFGTGGRATLVVPRSAADGADLTGASACVVDDPADAGELAALLRACGCAVLAPRTVVGVHEVLGVMAAGLPVLGPDLPWMAEQVTPATGVLVPARCVVLPEPRWDARPTNPVVHEPDVAALATAMGRMADDPSAAAAMGRAAQRLAGERHTWEAAAAAVAERLARIAAPRTPPEPLKSRLTSPIRVASPPGSMELKPWA